MSPTDGVYRCGRTSCDDNLFIRARSAVIVVFRQAPNFRQVEVTCLSCGCCNRLPAMQHLAEAQAAGCKVETRSVPDDVSVRFYEEATGRKVLILQNLSHDQHRLVRQYRAALAKITYLPEQAA